MLRSLLGSDMFIRDRVDVAKDFTMTCCQKVDNPGEKGNMGGFSIEVEKENKTVTEIHAPNLDGTAEFEAPQMICVPMDWCWPTERTHILTPYPKFQDWIASENSCPDWHDSSNRQSGYYNRTDIPALLPSAPTPDNPWGGSGEEGVNGISGELISSEGDERFYFYAINSEDLESAKTLLVNMDCKGSSSYQYQDSAHKIYGITYYGNSFTGDDLEKVKNEGGFYVLYKGVDAANFHVTIRIRIE